MERLTALLLFLPLAAAFDLLGRLLLRAVLPQRAPGGAAAPPAVLAMSLGVWTLAPLLFVLAASGLLTAPLARGLYLLLAAAGLAGSRSAIQRLSREVLLPLRGAGAFDRGLLALFAALAALQVTDGLNFPMGADQLAYHFPLARHMIASRSLEPLYGLPPSCILPQNVHLYYGFAMLVHSDVLGKLFVTFWGLLAYGLLYQLSRPLFGQRVARVALLVYAFTPWAVYKMHFPYVEIPLAQAALTAAVLFASHLRSGAGGPLVAAGAMVGIALGIKQTAWVLAPVLAAASLLAALHARRRGGRLRSGPVLSSLGAMALLGSPWFLRNLHYLGNPVWPLFGFGKYLISGPGFGDRDVARALRPEMLAGYLWSLFLNYGKDCYSFFSPFLLMALPFLPGAARRSAPARALLAVSAAGLVWSLILAPFSARYWFPFFALLCPVLAQVVTQTSREPLLAAVQRTALLLIGLGVTGFQAASTAALLRYPDRAALYATLPESGLADFVRGNVASGDRVLYPYENAYLFPASTIPMWANQGWVDFYGARRPEDVALRIREVGARYLVHSRERDPIQGVYGAALGRLVGEMERRGLAKPLFTSGDLSLLEVLPERGPSGLVPTRR